MGRAEISYKQTSKSAAELKQGNKKMLTWTQALYAWLPVKIGFFLAVTIHVGKIYPGVTSCLHLFCTTSCVRGSRAGPWPTRSWGRGMHLQPC